MGKKAETNFKERIRPDLDAIAGSWWVKTQMLALLGIPDFLGCINGYFIALELKRDDGTDASKLQKHILRKIIRAGGVGLVVSPENWPMVKAYLTRIASGNTDPRPQQPDELDMDA